MQLVFTRENGAPIHARSLLTTLETYATAAKVGHMRWHDWRHTHATLLAKASAPPRDLQDRLGHRSIAMTMDLYTHVLAEQQRQLARLIDRMQEPLAHDVVGSLPPGGSAEGH